MPEITLQHFVLMCLSFIVAFVVIPVMISTWIRTFTRSILETYYETKEKFNGRKTTKGSGPDGKGQTQP